MFPPDHALQRTRRERRSCNCSVPCAGSLTALPSRRKRIANLGESNVRLEICLCYSGLGSNLPFAGSVLEFS